MNEHEIEERDFGRGPRLWDADPDVCCAAFQLGACVHTETLADDDAYWIDQREANDYQDEPWEAEHDWERDDGWED